MPSEPTADERVRRDEVMSRVLDCIRIGEKIRLPAFDPLNPAEPGQFALQSIEENDFSGTLGSYKYQLEGEDDLLHLIVLRKDAEQLTPEQARSVAAFVFHEIPPALIWMKPGEFSQHFYVAHDELIQAEGHTL